MEKLTEAQRNPLFDLVKHQRQAGLEWIYLTDNDAIYPGSFSAGTEPITYIDETLLGLWQERGYIYVHHHRDEPGFGAIFVEPTAQLRLTQEALDYYNWMQKSRVRRWLVKQINALSSEMRAATIALIVAVLTIIISKWLGY